MPTIIVMARATAEELGTALGAKQLLPETENPVPELEGALVVKRAPRMKSFGVPELLEFSLTFSAGVASSIVANWLYEHLKGKTASTVTIDRVEVQLEQGAITKVIEEHRSRRG